MTEIEIVRQPVSLQHIVVMAERSFGDLVKVVVDADKGMMAIGGELHADEEAALLAAGSARPTSGASTCTRPNTARQVGSNSTR